MPLISVPALHSYDESAEPPLEDATKTHRSHQHSRRGRTETTTINITPPATPPPELAEVTSSKLALAKGYIALFMIVGIMVACLVGIFTNFGFERCNCNDLRNWWCGLLGACLMFLCGTAKEKFVK